MSDLASWSVRISDDNGAVCGAGLHLGDGLILTCAHVVRDAVRAADVAVCPAEPAFVEFPGLASGRLAAVAEPGEWWPYDDELRGDAAVLRLAAGAPQGAHAVPLTSECPVGAVVRAFGYPLERDFGVHAEARIMGETLARGWYQLDDSRLRGEQIRPGFSGAAAVLADSGRVAGMLSLATVDSGHASPRVSWMLPVRLLAERLRPVADALHAAPVPRQHRSGPPAADPGTSCPLPSDIRDFTGREGETADADEEIERAGGFPVVQAVFGMGGIGKTALAVHLAHRHTARYPDGQYLIDLQAHTADAEPLPPEQALRMLLRATLGQPSNEPGTLAELSAAWQHVVRSRRLVVVLDNAESFDQVEPLLPRAGQVLVLITSRRWLEELGVGYGVPSKLAAFDDDVSIELFTRIVGRARADAEPAALRDIARLCGHLPLAIRLKAAYAKGRPTWSLADIRDEMADEERAGAGTGGRSGVAEGGRLDRLRLGAAHPVRTAFLTSFRRLAPKERRLFQLLALHPPETMDRRAVEALAGDARDAQAGLAVLIRESLVNEHGRFRVGMHDLLSEYARDQLVADEPWEARRDAANRLIDFCLAVALAARRAQLPARPVADAADLSHARLPDVSTPTLALRWFEAEHRVLLGCIDLADQYGHASYSWRLPRAMGMYLALSARSKDAVPRYERGIDAAAAADRRAEADLRGLLGDALRAQGKPDRSLAEFRTARSLYLELGDAVAAADMLTRGSAPQRDTEGAEQSVAACTQAIAEYTAAGDSFGSAEAEYLLATAARLDGDRDRALGHLRRALELCQNAGFTAGQARCLNLMGVIQRLGGDYATAVGTLEGAVRLYREAHDNGGIAHAVNNLASALALAGRLEEAVGVHGEALELFRRHPYGYPDALLVAGDLRSRQGDHAGAERKLREAVRLYRPMRARFGEARAHLLLAAALRGQERHPEGAGEAGEALGLYLGMGNESGAAAARREVEACGGDVAAAGGGVGDD